MLYYIYGKKNHKHSEGYPIQILFINILQLFIIGFDIYFIINLLKNPIDFQNSIAILFVTLSLLIISFYFVKKSPKEILHDFKKLKKLKMDGLVVIGNIKNSEYFTIYKLLWRYLKQKASLIWYVISEHPGLGSFQPRDILNIRVNILQL